MSYVAKTDWKHDDPVTEQDLNRWETGIKQNTEKLRTVQEFALTTASGDAKDSITNVNTATTVGLFLIGSNSTGAPTTAVGLLYVWRRGSSHLLQEYWEINSNKRHHRTSIDNGLSWTVWQTLGNTALATTSTNGLMSSADKAALDNAQKWKLTKENGRSEQKANVNLDNEKLNSFFYVGTDAINKPEGAVSGWIQVEAVSDLYVVQTFRSTHASSTSPSSLYQRVLHNGIWQPWRKVGDENSIVNILMGNKITVQSNMNFIGKVSGNTLVNPHYAGRVGNQATLQSPTGTWVELSDSIPTSYSLIQSLDGSNLSQQTSTISGQIAQQRFSFNLIEHIQRTYGTIPGLSTADKVSWLKANIKGYVFKWYGHGSSPFGEKAYFQRWIPLTSSWFGSSFHSGSNSQKIETGASNGNEIDSNGFVHAIAYADPSDGETSSIISTDFIELSVEITTDIKMNLMPNFKPMWIDAALQNGWVQFDSTRKPQYSIGADGFVSLRGAVKSGTIGTSTPVMTLPTGFRPIGSHVFANVAGISGNMIATVQINESGQLSIISQGSVDNAYISLHNVRFSTT